MRSIWPESEHARRLNLDLVSVEVPAVPGLAVMFPEPGATVGQLRDNVPAEPGVVLLLRRGDRSDDTKLLVLADDVVEIHRVDDVREALMEATRKLGFLSRHYDYSLQLAYFLSEDFAELAALVQVWGAQVWGADA